MLTLLNRCVLAFLTHKGEVAPMPASKLSLFVGDSLHALSHFLLLPIDISECIDLVPILLYLRLEGLNVLPPCILDQSRYGLTLIVLRIVKEVGTFSLLVKPVEAKF